MRGRKLELVLCVAIALACLGSLTTIALSDTVPPVPPNDNYLGPIGIPGVTHPALQTYRDTENLTSATTQSDLFNPDSMGQPLGGGGPEPTNCRGAIYGNTIWYDINPAVPEQVELLTSGVPNVIALYQWSGLTSKITRRIGCQDQATASPNDYAVGVELKKGRHYTVQVGGLRTAAGVSVGPISFIANIALDTDGDEVLDAQDACPRLPGIQRLAGCPPAIASSLTADWNGAGTGLTFTKFEIANIPSTATAKVTCSCGLHQTMTAGRHASAVAIPAMIGHTLQAGSTFQIWVTNKPSGKRDYRFGAIGAYRKYTVLAGSLSDPEKRCLMPGSMKPQLKCPPDRQAK
jgi:hypothetical protein